MKHAHDWHHNARYTLLNKPQRLTANPTWIKTHIPITAHNIRSQAQIREGTIFFFNLREINAALWFVCMLLLPEGQMGASWKPYKKQRSFRSREAVDKKMFIFFEAWNLPK